MNNSVCNNKIQEWSMLNHKEILYLYRNKNLNCTQIGKKLKCSRRTVSRILKYNGVDIKPGVRSSNSIIGKTLGLLKVIDTKNGIAYCMCECGSFHKARIHSLKSGHTKSCGCFNSKSRSKSLKHVTGSYFCQIERSAKQRNIDFNITINDLEDLFIKQCGKCKLSGLDIVFAKTNSDRKLKIQTASLDRIDPNEGYVLNNIQWVHKDINKMKQQFNNNYFYELCKRVCKNANH